MYKSVEQSGYLALEPQVLSKIANAYNKYHLEEKIWYMRLVTTSHHNFV